MEHIISRKINIGIFIAEIFKKNIFEVDEVHEKKTKSKEMVDYEREERLKCYEEIQVNFISFDLIIDYNVYCKRTDNFLKLEEKLYIEFPELKFKNIRFLHDKREINRSFSLIENGIRNFDKIIIEEN